jgi:hypothetical protein
MAWTDSSNESCSGQITTILYEVTVTDDHDSQAQLTVVLAWQGKTLSGSEKMGIRGPVFEATLGPFLAANNSGPADTLSITITATDSGGKSRTITGMPVNVAQCPPPIG